jgi:predicted Zn finger-like uncharacterized protein
MIDISKQKIEITCPNCKQQIAVALQQVAAEDTVECPSCNQQIALKDEGGSAKKSIQDINKSFKDLDNVFKKFGKK